MKTYVLYHGSCFDGFASAWICRSVLPPDTEFIPVQYGQEPPVMEPNSIVYIVDFSYKRDVMRRILQSHHKVVVLDHHKTAQAELAGLIDEFVLRPDLGVHLHGSAELPIIYFDMNKSGGRLAWGHFYESRLYQTKEPRSRPWLVDYTEDRDLGRTFDGTSTLPNSREINAFIRSFALNFDIWDEWDLIRPGSGNPGRESWWENFVNSGSAIMRREKQIIDDHVRHAREIVLLDHKILSVNATTLFSDIAGELAKGRPFGAAWFVRSDGKCQWSLRSDKDGLDVSEIAKHFGGGGHQHAAGFETLAIPR